MPNTITSYTTFVAGTRARAAEVNTNFSNYRGDLIPINTDTATASDSVHDLGGSSHRWKDFYVGTLDLLGSTSTTNVVVQPRTAATAGGFDILNGSSTMGSWDGSGYTGPYSGSRNLPSGILATNAVDAIAIQDGVINPRKVSDTYRGTQGIGDSVNVSSGGWATYSSIAVQSDSRQPLIMVHGQPAAGTDTASGFYIHGTVDLQVQVYYGASLIHFLSTTAGVSDYIRHTLLVDATSTSATLSVRVSAVSTPGTATAYGRLSFFTV